MMHFTLSDIIAFEKQFRTNLINSISGYKNPFLIGTTNRKGQTNLAIFNSIVHIGAHPPLIGFISRPNTVERHTLENILEIGCYTLNHVTPSFYKQAHQTSARYPRNKSEFDATQLQESYLKGFLAPFVEVSNLKMGLILKEKIDIRSSHTHLIIGEIQHLFTHENYVDIDGNVDLIKAQSMAVSGLDTYYTTTKIAQLSYAKPDTNPTEQ